MDRLVAILIALQQRPETAQSLADKFEVSRRTIPLSARPAGR
ncbi:MAG: hypothetical protein C6W55_01020 [Thermobacillus sp.]|nr:HTH domain-containing protein [Thermobacillus sp.]REK59519.1 MAG: hypothetical protein C6W55_01020 [Thermobacillus sp.]